MMSDKNTIKKNDKNENELKDVKAFIHKTKLQNEALKKIILKLKKDKLQ